MEENHLVGDVDLLTVKTRSVTGIVTLISRTFFIRLISLLGVSLLALFLQRSDFGLFAGINNIVIILSYFSDIGLAASLIQKKTELTALDLKTTFTLQQILVVSGCLILGLLSPWIAHTYAFPAGGIWLLYSLILAFFLASLKTIPSVILERQLLFKNLAAVEVAENIVYWGFAVSMAWAGFGLYSYAWAVLLRGIVGTLLIYYLSPWRMGLQISKSSLKHLLKFGIPYQLNSFLAVIKDRFIELVVWKIIGNDGVGIISWARNYSEQPLRLVMDNVSKVTFPTFSRLQDHKHQLKSGIEKSLLFISASTFPFVVGLALLAPQVLTLIPRLSKWEPALLPLALFSINTAWASISTPLSNVLNAVGKVKINTALMVMWLVLAWVLTPLLATRFGFLGVAYATAIISFFSAIPIMLVRNITGFSIYNSVGRPFVAAVAMGVVTLVIKTTFPVSWFWLVINIFISGTVFCLTIYLLVGKTLTSDVRSFVHVLLKKK